MIKNFLILLFLLVTSSCSTYDKVRTSAYDYLAEFYNDMGKRGYLLSFDPPEIYVMDKLEGHREETVAVCYYNYPRRIVISKRHWDNMVDIERRSAVYHEAGHCVLNIQYHNNSRFTEDCPSSLMSEKLPNKECLEKYWEIYRSKLFLIKQ
jgi:hypothetical protein